jgi:hypothetical protein
MFIALEDEGDIAYLLQETSIDFSSTINVDTADDEAYFLSIHDRSLSEWQQAWESEHQDTDKFPDIFIPLTNRP